MQLMRFQSLSQIILLKLYLVTFICFVVISILLSICFSLIIFVNMSQLPRRYCIFGCDALVAHDVPFHRFPNPKKKPDLFAVWIAAVGSQFRETDHMKIYNNKRICDHHFDRRCKTTGGRLICSATPTVNLYRIQQTVGDFVQKDHTYCWPVRQSSQVRPMPDRTRTEDVGPSDQPLVREGATHSEKRQEAAPLAQGQVREGVTTRKRSSNETEPARVATRFLPTDTKQEKSRSKEARKKRGRFSHKKVATLTGISVTQAGPSSTGSSKRGRPEDSASPSTQGDAKRVTIHSDQGEINTHARATKDILGRLAVAICCSPPSRDLTPEEAEQVKAGLEDLLLYNDSTSPLPAFRGYPRVADGTVQMWCEDDDALTWLTHNVPRLHLPDTDIRLTVVKQSDGQTHVPTHVKASLFVPRYRGDIRRLHSTLIRQNKWYDMAKWPLYKATTVGGDNYGSYLTLGVPLEEVEKVLSRERRVSYLLGSLYVHFWPSTQPSDSKPNPTDKTETRTALTETQTDDTDIAQIRAAMADDQDAWPLIRTYPDWVIQLLASSLANQHGA